MEAASLLALILGIYGAAKFSGITGDWLARGLHMNRQALQIVAFIITFILIVILVRLLAKLFDRLAKAVALGPANRILGILFGTLKSAFILSVCLVVLNTIHQHVPFLPEKEIAESKLYKPVSVFAPALLPVLREGYFLIKPDKPETTKQEK